MKVLKRNDLHTQLTQGRDWYRVVVATMTDEQEAYEREASLVRYLETRDHQGGANIAPGGGPGHKGVPVPEDVDALHGAQQVFLRQLKLLRDDIDKSADPPNDARLLSSLASTLECGKGLQRFEMAVLRRELAEARELLSRGERR